MPVKLGLWRVDGDAVERVPPSGISSEERLEKGMFANQNVVAKLRQPFTLQRLNEVFDLSSE